MLLRYPGFVLSLLALFLLWKCEGGVMRANETSFDDYELEFDKRQWSTNSKTNAQAKAVISTFRETVIRILLYNKFPQGQILGIASAFILNLILPKSKKLSAWDQVKDKVRNMVHDKINDNNLSLLEKEWFLINQALQSSPRSLTAAKIRTVLALSPNFLPHNYKASQFTVDWAFAMSQYFASLKALYIDLSQKRGGGIEGCEWVETWKAFRPEVIEAAKALAKARWQKLEGLDWHGGVTAFKPTARYTMKDGVTGTKYEEIPVNEVKDRVIGRIKLDMAEWFFKHIGKHFNALNTVVQQANWNFDYKGRGKRCSGSDDRTAYRGKVKSAKVCASVCQGFSNYFSFADRDAPYNTKCTPLSGVRECDCYCESQLQCNLQDDADFDVYEFEDKMPETGSAGGHTTTATGSTAPTGPCFDENKDDQSTNMGGGGCHGKKDTVEACQKLCQDTSGCKRFVYVKNTYNGVHGTGIRKTCCLKDKDDASYKEVQDVVSGPAKCSNHKATMQLMGNGHCNAGYYAGWDGKGTANQDACNLLCLSEKQCTFASYVNDVKGVSCSRYKGKSCIMDTSSEHIRNHVTYYKDLGDQAPTPCFHTDKDYNIANWGKCIKKDSLLECQQACQGSVGCGKFSYVTDTYNGIHGTGARKSCCLKPTQAAELVDAVGVTSGPKNCPVVQKMFCTKEDRPCAFPFTYKGKTYNDCTQEGHHTPWCSVFNKADGEMKKWGECVKRTTCIDRCNKGNMLTVNDFIFDLPQACFGVCPNVWANRRQTHRKTYKCDLPCLHYDGSSNVAECLIRGGYTDNDMTFNRDNDKYDCDECTKGNFDTCFPIVKPKKIFDNTKHIGGFKR